MTVKVAVCGALGKMGQEVVKTVLNDPELDLVGVADVGGADRPVSQALGLPSEIPVRADLKVMLTESRPQVCVDFTHPSVVLGNTLAMVEADCRPVIGTTGLSPENLETIRASLAVKGLGGMVVPNFAIGAILMMKFARQAAKYFDHAEIIELHHNKKADAPSGTAIKTAELMAAALAETGNSGFGPTNAPEKEIFEGARGGQGPGNIQIHSVRLPGLVAHQEVLFGGPGQMLTIRHDSLDRTSFMPGVALACKEVMKRSGLTYGLEEIL